MSGSATPIAKLGDLTSLISSGSTPKGGSEVYLAEGPIMLIRSQNVRMNELTLHDVAYITEEINAGMNRSKVQSGDVLLNITGASIGRVACFDIDGVRANVNQHVCIIRSKPNGFAPRYLTHLISSPEFQSEIDRLQHGGTRQALTFSQISEFKIPLPPLAEQRRIADVLDRAEALRAKRRAALAQLDSLTQSLFLDLFGDPATNPKGWPVAELGKLCEKVIDCPHATPTYATGRTEYPCVRSSDIQNSDLSFADTKYVEKLEYEKRIARGKPQLGDVIYCREGARFGNAARIVQHMTLCLGQRMMLFRPDRKTAIGEYLWAFLASPAAYRQATSLVGGSAAPHVNIRDIIAFRLPLPPIALQREFARRVTAVETLKTAHRASMAELDALFASLQHRAFRGEL